MKRSEINRQIKLTEKLMQTHKFLPPPFINWTPEEWAGKSREYDEIRDAMLGWDVTDFGLGEYAKYGIALITLRNGKTGDPRYPKPYAEKIIRIQEGQISPFHFHWKKMEDIINRGGGILSVVVYNADADDALAGGDVEVATDGRRYLLPAGSSVRLAPGESITLPPRCYHEIGVEPGTGEVLFGEVSVCNDDANDNRFLKPCGRYPVIDEDEPPYRLLCNEYPRAQ